MRWINAIDKLPLNNGKYLVYHSASREFVICEFNGKLFSYTYWNSGEMTCEFATSKFLWWTYLERPE